MKAEWEQVSCSSVQHALMASLDNVYGMHTDVAVNISSKKEFYNSILSS